MNEQSESVRSLRHHLSESLKLRVLNIPLAPKHHCEKPVRIAVLFSGGLDCTVLARMAHDILPLDQQIDLINVAFENPRVVKAAKKAALSENHALNGSRSQRNEQMQRSPSKGSLHDLSPYESCPDRTTGRKAFRELHHVCPNRTWRFVAVSP